MSTPARSRRLLAAERPGEAARALAERHVGADERPALRKDIKFRRQVQMGDVAWIVKNPETQKYFMFRDVEWGLIKLFDGTRTREEILREYNRHVRAPIEMSLVLNYEESLRKMQLIELSVAEKSLEVLDRFKHLRERKAEEKSEGFNVFFIMFHVLDPDRFLNRTAKYVRWIWTPPVVAVTCVAAAWTVGVFAINGKEIWAQTLELYKFVGRPLLDIVQFFVILSLVGAIHEFSHAYVVKFYGGEVHDIGFALFYFTPAFYCNTSDSYMFPNRWHKFYVTIAGIYIEGIICTAATFLWVASYPDTVLHAVAYKTMLLTGFSTVFFNINPLIKVDGYNALVSVLQLPGLREGAFRMIATSIQKNIFRLPVEVPAMGKRKRRIFWIYGILSMIYTAMLMWLISGWVANFYNKYFQDFAIVLILLTLYYIFRKRVRQIVRVGKLFYLDKKELLMSPRSRVPLAVAGAVLLLLLFLPWSRRTIRADAVLRPVARTVLEAPEDAVVAQILVREGDTVEPGQPIVRLTSAAAEENEQRLAIEMDLFERESSRERDAANAARAYQAARRAASAEIGLRSAGSRREYLILRSPIRGRVLTHRPEDFSGRFVVEGTDLVELGDTRRMAADVAVSERLLTYLAPGASVSALARSTPFGPRRGRVERISSAAAGAPATVREGADPLAPSTVPDRFLAVAVFDNSDGALMPGSTVRVKIRSAREAYALRAWRVFWRWLRTVFW